MRNHAAVPMIDASRPARLYALSPTPYAQESHDVARFFTQVFMALALAPLDPVLAVLHVHEQPQATSLSGARRLETTSKDYYRLSTGYPIP